ncbi:sulfatase-like hydrolase/transferase [Novipirellula sp. SH528]|uniref:sulfatase-like hydrolase/transferase n=1 Tax=Novipirellula sp. SH528 TaxID=3454466 RepID=UPI003FA11ED5
MTNSIPCSYEFRDSCHHQGNFSVESGTSAKHATTATCRRVLFRQATRLLCWLSMLIGCCCQLNVLSAAERPNVVMILADDQSYRDFGFMGNAIVHTPHLDRLAASSARYVNGYVPMSVCRPSLATLLTGLYPHQHGIHFNHPPPGLRAMQAMSAAEYHATRATSDYLIQQVPTLPRILSQHGYACLQTGKHWEGDYRTAGFTDGMTLGRPADRLGPITGTREQSGGEWVAHGNGDAGLIIGRETMQPIYDFVDEHAGRQPFFVWYAPFLPHSPYDAPDRFRRLYDGKDVAEHLLPYYAEIARFDETIGALLDHLRKKDLLSNTLVVFASDNGLRPHRQRHEQQDARSKLSQYEDGLRTPILIRWDGHVPPSEYQPLVRTVDLVPTVLSAVGLSAEVTPRMRGLDLMPTAIAGKSPPERPAFGAIYPNDAVAFGQPSRHVRGRWVREGDFKLVVPGPATPALPRALFNLASDPEERSNLAADPAQADRITALNILLDQWWSATDDADVTQR